MENAKNTCFQKCYISNVKFNINGNIRVIKNTNELSFIFYLEGGIGEIVQIIIVNWKMKTVTYIMKFLNLNC